MASAYLDRRRQELEGQRQAAKNAVVSKYQNEIYQLDRSRPKKGDDTGLGCFSLIAGIVLTALTGGLFLVGILVFVVIYGGGKLAMSNSQRQENEKIDRRIQELNGRMQEELRQTENRYDKLLVQEENSYKMKVKAAMAKYAGRTAQSKPIVDWLAQRYDKQIRSADRKPYVREIQAHFTFKATATEIQILSPLGNNYGVSERYDLFKNRFNNLNDFEDRVGFSRAMAKLVQFEMISRFPKDPVAPSAVQPKITITSDDETMYLHYTVPNPNYKHAVNL